MTISFIGGGNMARALIIGLLNDGTPAQQITVVELNTVKRKQLQREFGVITSIQLAAAAHADCIILAVKPQEISAVAKSLDDLLPHQLVISIAAGIRLNDLARWFGTSQPVLVRAMPNTPAQVGEGMTALCGTYSLSPKNRLSPDQIQLVESILNSVGKTIWVSDEKQMDAVTAISGSGPAYMFYFLEALQQAGTELGLSVEQSRLLALQTMQGAVKLAAGGTEDFDVLRAQVTSKGGTTEQAITSMQAAQVKQHIIQAIQAAAARSVELGDLLGKD